MKKIFDAGLQGKQFNRRAGEHDQPQEIDPRIFSRVYSHVSRHRDTADTGILLDLISAISLDRSASYFEVLERLEPRTRDLGLELLKTKLHGAFPPEAWEDAYQFAKELNQRSSETIKQGSAARPRGQDSPPGFRIAQEPKLEARHASGSFRVVSNSVGTRTRDPLIAATAKSADLETRIGPDPKQREPHPFRPRERTAFARVSPYGGFDGFKYLWGGVAAAAVIGLFVLVVALDERVLDRRFEMFTSWLPEPVDSPPQGQEPLIAGVDATHLTPTPAQTPEGAPDVFSEQSVLPAEEPTPVAGEPTAIEDDKVAITPPLAHATESAVPGNSLPPEDVPLSAPPQEQAAPAAIAPAEDAIAPPLVSASESSATEHSALAPDVPDAPPPQEPAVEQPAPAVNASERPKPVRRAVSQKAKSDSKVRSKPAKPPLAKRPAPPTNSPSVETAEPVASQSQSKMPEAPHVAEPPAKPASENAPPAPVVERTSETTPASVDKPGSDSVAAPAQLDPAASQTRQKVIANPSFVERLMGFKPGERIAPIQPGRRATQPDFIRQLENVDGPDEGVAGADLGTN